MELDCVELYVRWFQKLTVSFAAGESQVTVLEYLDWIVLDLKHLVGEAICVH